VGEKSEVDNIKKKLSTLYDMTDLGPVKRFLGICVERDGNTVKIHQKPYIDNLLQRYGMQDCSPVATPMQPGTTLQNDDGTVKLQGKETTWYKQLVGSLMYLMTATRPDLAYTMSRLSKFFEQPSEMHANAAKRVLRYLKGTTGKGIKYNGNGVFAGYTDADFAGDVDDRKSTGGFVFILHGGAVSWKAKKQALPALSTVEAEYIAGAEATKEAVSLGRLLHRDLGMQLSTVIPTLLHFDNQGAMALASNNGNAHNRTKHIDVKWHFIRAYIENGLIKVSYLPTAVMVADIMTKALAKERHLQHMHAMGMQALPEV
jgi:hypothetical protein